MKIDPQNYIKQQQVSREGLFGAVGSDSYSSPEAALRALETGLNSRQSAYEQGSGPKSMSNG